MRWKKFTVYSNTLRVVCAALWTCADAAEALTIFRRPYNFTHGRLTFLSPSPTEKWVVHLWFGPSSNLSLSAPVVQSRSHRCLYSNKILLLPLLPTLQTVCLLVSLPFPSFCWSVRSVCPSCSDWTFSWCFGEEFMRVTFLVLLAHFSGCSRIDVTSTNPDIVIVIGS